MNIAEMHASFALRLQEADAQRQLSLNPGETDVYLNLAQLSLVKERAPQLGANRIITSDLAPLIQTHRNLVPSGVQLYSTEKVFDLPEDTLYFIRSEVYVTRSGYPRMEAQSLMPCVSITEDDVETYRVNLDNDPWIINPGVIQREDQLIVYVDADTTVANLDLVHLKHPQDMLLHPTSDSNNVDSELPPHLHDEIVDRAVRITLMDILPKTQ